MKIQLNSLMRLTIILICSVTASVQGSVIVNSCGKFYEGVSTENSLLSNIRQKLELAPRPQGLKYKIFPSQFRIDINLSSKEFMNLIKNRSALLEIDGFEITVNENKEGYRAKANQSKVIEISTTDLVKRLDWVGFGDNVTIESAIVEMYRLNQNSAITSITGYRKNYPSRTNFEQLKIVSNPESLTEGHPVYIKYTDRFDVHISQKGGYAKKMVSYEEGRLFKIGSEPWIVLVSGKVVRLNSAVYEIRDNNKHEIEQSLSALLIKAYRNYGLRWGHNANFQQRGSTGREEVVKGPHPEYEVGIGMPVEQINSLKELVLRNNSYYLTGIVILFKDPTNGEIRLATYSLSEIGPQIFQKEGLNLPGVGLVSYTQIIGATGRAGESYGQLRSTLEH